MGDGEQTLTIALLSGTDEKLNAAALLTAGAAALGRKVDILLQYWALDAFRAGNLTKDHGLAPEAGPDGTAEVRVHACSLSMDLFGLAPGDLDPLVDDVEGITAFMLAADGQLVFI